MQPRRRDLAFLGLLRYNRGTRAYSSVGQSARFTSVRSQVRALLCPPAPLVRPRTTRAFFMRGLTASKESYPTVFTRRLLARRWVAGMVLMLLTLAACDSNPAVPTATPVAATATVAVLPPTAASTPSPAPP